MHVHTCTRRSLVLGSASALLASHAFAAASDEERFYGHWSGTLVAGSRTLPLRFEISLGPTVRLVSIAENDTRVADQARIRGDEIDLQFKSILGRFEGKLVSPDRLEGTWHQTFYHLPLQLTRGDEQTATSAAVPLTQTVLAELRERNGIPAMGAAWQRATDSPRIMVDGRRSVDATTAVTTNDRWHLGSITKSMTATLVGTFIGSGELHWTSTIGEWLGPQIPALAESTRSITLLELLSHRAGLPANLPDQDLATFALETANIREERSRFVRRALSLPRIGPARETFLYSNLGYVIAAAMLEAATQRSWEQLIRERVFDPLQLSSAGFGAPGHEGKLDEPVGHRLGAMPRLFGERRRAVAPGTRIRADNVAAMGPAGRVHMSLADLCRYLQAHRDRQRLFSADIWDALHTAHFGGSYALGWERRSDGALWHNGSNTLWYAEVVVTQDVVACATANDGALATTSDAVGSVLLQACAAARESS